MPFLDRDGVRLYYDVAGHQLPGRPPVLLTHGFGASSHMFAANVPVLATDRTVVTWDIRGHAQSDGPDDPDRYSAALALDDIAALIDVVGADRAVLAGHSLGGYLSLSFHLDHPERVAGLVLIDTGPGFRNPTGRERWNRMAERYATDLRRDGLAGYPASDEFSPDVHRGAVGLIHAARRILPQQDERVIESLPSIAVPTLVIVGELDEPFLASAQYMAERIPDAELVVIAGAGHAPSVSHPEQFNAAVRSFLGRATDGE